MIRDFNVREFRIVRHGMDDARELLEMGEPKSALAALREPKKILERKINNIRILAILLIEEAEILIALRRFSKAEADLDRALEVLDAIDDHESTIREKIADLYNRLKD
ncbi:hypothetical protein [Allobaculum sp. JKK-2023]|uniref:hypothetical protein n=1 Tax=Allobaculum sp. JKK-2023 TaxID=3108943 RepID=UPI002B0559DA|nr:hypothetical protein [Allobaculum sp. JKK-2023]